MLDLLQGQTRSTCLELVVDLNDIGVSIGSGDSSEDTGFDNYTSTAWTHSSSNQSILSNVCFMGLDKEYLIFSALQRTSIY